MAAASEAPPDRRGLSEGEELSVTVPSIERSVADGCTLVTSDLFDTVLLRDHSSETQRLAEAAEVAARTLGIGAAALRSLRWSAHDAAYRAVALERPHGDARLERVAAVMASALGLGPDAAAVLVDAEVETDATHLRPNTALVDLYRRLRARGTRVVAVSDTYYSTRDLRRLLVAVVGDDPFDEVYSSADLGRTKHAGSIFGWVASREGVAPREIVHVGDSVTADVEQPTLAGWAAVHAPRTGTYRFSKRAGQLRAVPLLARRSR